MLEGLSAFLLIAVPGLFQTFGSPEPIALTGCVVQEVRESEPARFILRDAKKNPHDTDESGASYLLIPQAGLTLEGYVTRTVRVTGTLANKTDVAAIKHDDLPGLKAERLKLDADTCPEEAESEEDGSSEPSEAALAFLISARPECLGSLSEAHPLISFPRQHRRTARCSTDCLGTLAGLPGRHSSIRGSSTRRERRRR